MLPTLIILIFSQNIKIISVGSICKMSLKKVLLLNIPPKKLNLSGWLGLFLLFWGPNRRAVQSLHFGRCGMRPQKSQQEEGRKGEQLTGNHREKNSTVTFLEVSMDRGERLGHRKKKNLLGLVGLEQQHCYFVHIYRKKAKL